MAVDSPAGVGSLVALEDSPVAVGKRADPLAVDSLQVDTVEVYPT